MSDKYKIVNKEVQLVPFKAGWGLSKTLCMAMSVFGVVFLIWMPWVTMSWFVVVQIIFGLMFLMNELGYDILRRDGQATIIELAGSCQNFHALTNNQKAQIGALCEEVAELTDEIISLKEEVTKCKTQINHQNLS